VRTQLFWVLGVLGVLGVSGFLGVPGHLGVLGEVLGVLGGVLGVPWFLLHLLASLGKLSFALLG